MTSTCPHNMVNFGLLTAEIYWRVWDTPANFNRFRVMAALLHSTSVVDVSQTLRRWTEGATYVRQGDHHVGHWLTFLVWSKFTKNRLSVGFRSDPLGELKVPLCGGEGREGRRGKERERGERREGRSPRNQKSWLKPWPRMLVPTSCVAPPSLGSLTSRLLKNAQIVLPTTLVVRVMRSIRCVCAPRITFDRNDLWPRYSAAWFVLTLSRSFS